MEGEHSMLGKEELNEMYENMAKLLLMAENPSIRFSDLQEPGNEIKERLNDAAARLMSAADAAKSENPKLQSEADQTYREYRKQCRGVIRKFNFEKETLYALGKHSEEMSKEEQDKILLDPQNAGTIRKLMENVAECIQKADRTQGLSEYLKKGELRHSSKIDYVAGQVMGLADEYGALEQEWLSQKKGVVERSQEKQEKQGRQAKQKEKEENLKEEQISVKKGESENQKKQVKQEKTTELEDKEEQAQNTKTTRNNLRAVPAPKVKDVEGLPTWERMINWIAEKLGFNKVFTEKKETQKQTRKVGTQAERTNTGVQDSWTEESEWEESDRQVRDPQNEKEEQTSRKTEKDWDYERQIHELQIENLRKDSMIKYLQGELLRVQIIEQNLKNEKLLREIAETQNKQKGANVNSKTDKEQNSKKPDREKISFSQLAKEESSVGKKRPHLESVQPQKVRFKDDSMMEYRHMKTPEKIKKELSPSK